MAPLAVRPPRTGMTADETVPPAAGSALGCDAVTTVALTASKNSPSQRESPGTDTPPKIQIRTQTNAATTAGTARSHMFLMRMTTKSPASTR